MKKVFIWILIVLVFLLLGFFLYNNFGDSLGTYSRFKGSIKGTTNVDVAIPVTETNLQSFDVPLDTLAPGESYTYDFSVTNKDNLNRISDVNMNYTIEVVRSTNLPLNVSIQKGDDTSNILNNYVSPVYMLPHSVEKVDNYKLVVTWNSSDNDYRYADLIEVLTIKINGVQKID